jgi:ubiquinone/menaquinone biosynthesis C-methylase UbiE
MEKPTVRSEFGKHARDYVRSEVHAKGASLGRMVELCRPQADWRVLDIATGAGHTAFAFAPHVEKVRATDVTEEMLALAAEGAAERGLENVLVEYAEAERLPYSDGSFDLVTCRIAAHHFPDVEAFLDESARVLRPGGLFTLVDNIVPGGEAGAYVNAFEKLRDPSHGRCLSKAEWEAGCVEAGLGIAEVEILRKRIMFDFWASRHDAVMQSYLKALLMRANDEAAEFLQPETADGELSFHLTELLLVGRKPAG